jgi:hypothetical protein
MSPIIASTTEHKVESITKFLGRFVVFLKGLNNIKYKSRTVTKLRKSER